MAMYSFKVGPITWTYFLDSMNLKMDTSLRKATVPVPQIESFGVYSVEQDLDGGAGGDPRDLDRALGDLSMSTGQLKVKWRRRDGKIKVNTFNIDLRNLQVKDFINELESYKPGSFVGVGTHKFLCKAMGLPNYAPLIVIITLLLVAGGVALWFLL